MARLFSDGAGTTYDGTNGKFVNAPFSTYTPFNYTDALLQPSPTVFKQKVDNSLAGAMRDCGECHVGGGGNEYVPNKRPEARTTLRDYVFGTAVTAFNYFIDSYGTKGDGTNLDGTPASFAATANDYSQTGVLEMDCLMCHLKGYNWEQRKEAVRVGKFDASRVAGAQLGTPSTTPGDGVNVAYDPARVVPNGDNTALRLAGTVAANIQATPDSNNCADCHMREHSVDWKKRGDQWLGSSEVHYSIGCMGCHKRKDADFSRVGTSGFAGLKGTYGFGNISTNHLLDDSKKLGQCDPAKGTAPYGSLWNAMESNKFAVTKNCAGCHIYGGDYDPATEVVKSYETLGAPNPTAAHQAKGLAAKIVQKGNTMAGAANASHIDLMTCETCHARKLGNFSGGAMVDGTGTDAEGRLADHENANVTRTSMTNNTFMSWQASNGQLYNANLSTSAFWRDKNDVNFDANNDGRAGGMDALLQTHVATINRTNTYSQGPRIGQPLVALTQLGTVTGADVADHISAIDRDLEVQLGLKATPADANTRSHTTRLSFMGVTFKTNHNVSPASAAWGAGGCADCHAGSTSNTLAGTIGDTSAAGFYSGKFVVKGNTLNMSWTGGGAQVTPFASVNGSTQPSDFHPGVKERSGVRSIAVQFASNGTTIRDIDRSEGLYENAFKARNTAFGSSITGSAITFPAGTSTTTTSQGWLLKIEATNNAGQTVVARTKQVSALVTDMTGLLNNLGTAFTGTWDGTAYSGGFAEFGIRANAAGTGLLIEGRNGYTVRLHPQSDVGPLGLTGSIWADKQYKGIATDQTGTAVATTDRKTWVAYLNSFGDPAQQAKVGIGIDPVALFAATFPDADPNTAGYQLLVNTPYTLAADTAVNTSGIVSYSMVLSDNTTGTTSIGKTFTTLGTYAVTLNVTDEEGKIATLTRSFTVVNPPTTGMTISPTTAVRGVASTYTFGNLKDHDSLRIIWADGTSTTLAHVGGTGSSATAPHTYGTTGTKKLTVLVYKNGVQVDSKYNYVTVGL